MQLDLATLLAQWAAGGLLFCWVTTRRREVGIGYGWLMRITYGVMAILSVVAGAGDAGTGALIRNVGAGLMALAAAVALLQSYVRRAAGVAGQRETRERRSARVAAMTGRVHPDDDHEPLPEFDPRLDLLAPVFGFAGLFGAASFVGGDYALSLARLVVGAGFLGAVSDAMLLGHWYLVQPGLGRDPIRQLVKAVAILWPLELVVYLIPVGMVSVLNGSIDDGYGGLMGWMWIVAAITTIGLVIATWFALEERSYSAVMAATGLLYLAILTGFGMDLLPRALLS
ncbi:MAG TPA: hypothetical protein VFW97_08035 [Acidimicrobiia bacterium]|nr:hypothetical protein [Acidimicrobiia bacterium]